MNHNKESTAVVFRKWRDGGGIFALFPMEAYTSCDGGWLCYSYAHTGQHSGASPELTRDGSTLPATRKESASLARELRSIGYRLRILSRIPRNAYDVRQSQVKR